MKVGRMKIHVHGFQATIPAGQGATLRSRALGPPGDRGANRLAKLIVAVVHRTSRIPAGRYSIDWRRELATFLNSGQSSSVQSFAEIMSLALQVGAALFDPQSESMADSAVRESRHPGVEDREIVVLPQDIRQPLRVFATFLKLRGSESPRDVDLVEQILHLFSPFVQAPVGWFVPYPPECPSSSLIDPAKALADGGLIQLSLRDL